MRGLLRGVLSSVVPFVRGVIWPAWESYLHLELYDLPTQAILWLYIPWETHAYFGGVCRVEEDLNRVCDCFTKGYSRTDVPGAPVYCYGALAVLGTGKLPVLRAGFGLQGYNSLCQYMCFRQL